MYEYGYGQRYAEDLVDQLQTETDGMIVLSQLAVVVACGDVRATWLDRARKQSLVGEGDASHLSQMIGEE